MHKLNKENWDYIHFVYSLFKLLIHVKTRLFQGRCHPWLKAQAEDLNQDQCQQQTQPGCNNNWQCLEAEVEFKDDIGYENRQNFMTNFSADHNL